MALSQNVLRTQPTPWWCFITLGGDVQRLTQLCSGAVPILKVAHFFLCRILGSYPELRFDALLRQADSWGFLLTRHIRRVNLFLAVGAMNGCLGSVIHLHLHRFLLESIGLHLWRIWEVHWVAPCWRCLLGNHQALVVSVSIINLVSLCQPRRLTSTLV